MERLNVVAPNRLYVYKTEGICPKSINIKVIDGVIQGILFEGGCDGNGKAVAALCLDQPVNEIIEKLNYIKCGKKDTSCAKQLCEALELIK